MIARARALRVWCASRGFLILCGTHSVGAYMMACAIPLKNDLLTGLGGTLALVPVLWAAASLLRNYLRQNP